VRILDHSTERMNHVLRLEAIRLELGRAEVGLKGRLTIRCVFLYDLHDADNGRDFTAGVVEKR